MTTLFLHRSPPPEYEPTSAAPRRSGDAPDESPDDALDDLPADRGVALRGLAGPAVALLACAMGGVLTGGVAQRCADGLDRGPTPGEKGSSPAGPPAV
ncbi:hypothetical protein, partial [Streptomyces sp. CBMA29]|uniref:hypothetical protein n=1 Tax=Streptomyces sp. CBMA29 TaxID=1896314 RepID=UPI001661D1AC